MALPRPGRDHLQQVDQRAVVRHVLGDVGVRPVCSPQHAVGKALDQQTPIARRVVERRALARDALRSADLHPEARVLHELEQETEGLLLDPGAGVDAPHVIDDPGQGKLAQERRSEEHTSAIQSLMRISYAVFYLKKKTP